MFDLFIDVFIVVFKFLFPFLLIFFILCLAIILLLLYWYFYFYHKGMRMLGSSSDGPKRIPLWKRLFVEAPRRYVLDMFERPADYFDVCGLHIFCGEQGSGKTIAMVELILRLQKCYPKAKTITNFGLVSETTVLKKWEMLLNYVNGYHGVIVGIDEIQNWFQSGHNKLPEGMLEIVTQNRKNRRILLCTAQVFTRVSKAIREQVSMVYEPHTFFGCFTVVVMYKPVFDTEGNVIKRNYRGIYSFVHTDELRKSYDTYKCIHMLSKEGFKDSAKTIRT